MRFWSLSIDFVFCLDKKSVILKVLNDSIHDIVTGNGACFNNFVSTASSVKSIKKFFLATKLQNVFRSCTAVSWNGISLTAFALYDVNGNILKFILYIFQIS